MARALSEEKRQALLDAAADFVATLGTGASMAKIAKAAGVTESMVTPRLGRDRRLSFN